VFGLSVPLHGVVPPAVSVNGLRHRIFCDWSFLLSPVSGPSHDPSGCNATPLGGLFSFFRRLSRDVAFFSSFLPCDCFLSSTSFPPAVAVVFYNALQPPPFYSVIACSLTPQWMRRLPYGFHDGVHWAFVLFCAYEHARTFLLPIDLLVPRDESLHKVANGVPDLCLSACAPVPPSRDTLPFFPLLFPSPVITPFVLLPMGKSATK